MRNAFALEITALAATDERVVLLSGDIGNRLFDQLKGMGPERFYNCGVAEANMTGLAAGLAMCGLKPVTYTIAPFNTTRCLEQIKLDVCYHNLPVVIVGVGSGLSYARLGVSHHCLDDFACLRVMPNLKVIAPADAVETRLALRAALAQDGPVYLRLGKKNEPLLHRAAFDFVIGKAVVHAPGDEVCLLAAGTTVSLALEAAGILREQGIDAGVVGMHTVKPLDTDMLADIFGRCRVAATIEEHFLAGGFGSAVAEWAADNGPFRTKIARFGVPDAFLRSCGSQSGARRLSGIDAASVASGVALALARQG